MVFKLKSRCTGRKPKNTISAVQRGRHNPSMPMIASNPAMTGSLRLRNTQPSATHQQKPNKQLDLLRKQRL